MITDISRIEDVISGSDNGYFNCDCTQGMAYFPDNFFDLAIVDPPYGINIGHKAIGGVKVQAYGESTKALAKQNFINRSMIARHRTVGTLRNYSEYQKRRLYGVETSFLTISVRRVA